MQAEICRDARNREEELLDEGIRQEVRVAVSV
jgi:hypothetical protein